MPEQPSSSALLLQSGELLAELYDELHKLARSFLRNERAWHTLQPSALINEAWMRLVTHRTMEPADRPHFLRLAARAMRHVLIDYARVHRAAKRDREQITAALASPGAGGADPEDYLTIGVALKKLVELDPRQAEIVELRFFGGLSVEETAAVMGISEKTVKRDWAMARAWLRGELDRASAEAAAAQS